MSVPPPVDQAKAQELLANPNADTTSLIAVAYHHPALRPAVAAHPNASPELLSWLDSFGDAAASVAVAARRAQADPPAAAQAPQPEFPPAAFPPPQPPVQAQAAAPPPPPAPAVPAQPPQPPIAPPQPQAGPQPAWPSGAPASGMAPAAPPAVAPNAYSPAPPAAGPAAAKPKRKGLMIGLIAGVVVVALAVVGFLVVPKMFKSTNEYSWDLPDFFEKPTLSALINATEGLPDGTYVDTLGATAMADMAYVTLTNGTCSAEECGFDRWLRGISTKDNKIVWTFDFWDLGVENPHISRWASRPDGLLGMAVWNRADTFREEGATTTVQGVLAVLKAETGELVSQADVEWLQGPKDTIRVVTLRHGVMVTEPVLGSDGYPMIAAYSATDLTQEVWSTDAYSSNDAIDTDWRTINYDWVLTPAGYLSIEDGTLAPWGGDVDMQVSAEGELIKPWLKYTSRRNPFILRETRDEDGNGTCIGWDIDKDQPTWTEPAECSTAINVSGHGNVYFGYGPNRTPGSSTIAYAFDTGEELWENTSGTPLGSLDGALVVVLESEDKETLTLTMVDPKTGESIKDFDIPNESSRVYGGEVLYVATEGDSRSLEAHSVRPGDADPLWTIKLGEDDKVEGRGTHVVVWNKKGIRVLTG